MIYILHDEYRSGEMWAFKSRDGLVDQAAKLLNADSVEFGVDGDNNTWGVHVPGRYAPIARVRIIKLHS